ncbi:MAG: hypothetical protein IT450_16300 [Phycisphaerales bacterium]|nr:hypothetical protein [Phycisphaerales bacterium]
MPKSPEKPRLVFLLAKWFLTALFLAFPVLFVFSLIGNIDWESPHVVYCANLAYGSFYFGKWNPDYAATSPYMPSPGWSGGLCTYMGASIEWLPRFETTRSASGLVLPIWIPAFVVGAIAAVLWWRQRRATAASLRAFALRLRPARPVRTRVWAVLVATVVVFALGLSLACLIESLPTAFSETGSVAQVVTSWIHTWVVGTLFFGSPLLGFLIVWGWARFRNRLLFSSGDMCRPCGYNLTGNVSGVCPECGRKVDPAPLNTTSAE